MDLASRSKGGEILVDRIGDVVSSRVGSSADILYWRLRLAWVFEANSKTAVFEIVEVFECVLVVELQ